MTEQEFATIVDRINGLWPSLVEWFTDLTASAKSAQRERRRLALIDLSIADVERAVAELAKMPRAPWQEYGDKPENAFATIGDKAREYARQRAPSAESERLVKAGTRRRGGGEVQRLVSASGLVEQFVRDRRDGKLPNAKAVREWFDRHDPMTANEEDQKRNRYLCLPCRDSGRHEVVAQIITRDDGTRTWTTSSAACECEAGREFRERHELARLPVYDETKHVRVVAFATWEDIVAEMGRVREREFAGKRIDSFDAFNQQGAA